MPYLISATIERISKILEISVKKICKYIRIGIFSLKLVQNYINKRSMIILNGYHFNKDSQIIS